REATIVGCRNGQRSQSPGETRIGRDQRSGRQPSQGYQSIAEQCRTWNATRASERPETEGQGSQQSKGAGKQQWSTIEASDRRNRQHVGKQRTQHDGGKGTDNQAGQNAAKCKCQDLYQADREQQAAGCAQAAQRRDRPSTRVQPGADGVGDADA